MPALKNQLDEFLLDLAWSLWTELGVAGSVKRQHQKVLIGLEELILLTTGIMDLDPRLRDESLDWCASYHRFISISRLRTLLKDTNDLLILPFSEYAKALNTISSATWPVLEKTSSFKLVPSHKSCLHLGPNSGALLHIQTRSVFGTGAKADLIAHFLTHPQQDFSASDLTLLGYTKQNMLTLLEELCISGWFEKFPVRNQFRYRFIKQQLISLFPLPKFTPNWRIIVEILLRIHHCLQKIERSSESTQMVEIRNLLSSLQPKLQILKLKPPPFQPDYLSHFTKWLLNSMHELCFPK
jgi:hypothetical protein